MPRILQGTVFQSLGIRLIDQTYEFSGDTNILEMKNPVSENNPIKTFTTKGSIKFEILDTNDVAISKAPGKVFPHGPKPFNQTKFKITALEDDTHIHCVQPYRPGEKIIHTETDLLTGQSIDITKGNLVFVFGDNYKVLDNMYSTFQIFAVQNSDIVIQAINDCRVVVFKNVSV
jgi:hypothetical protein